MGQAELLEYARKDKKRLEKGKGPNIYYLGYYFFLGSSLEEAIDCVKLALKYGHSSRYKDPSRNQKDVEKQLRCMSGLKKTRAVPHSTSFYQEETEYLKIVETILNSKIADELVKTFKDVETLRDWNLEDLTMRVPVYVREKFKKEFANKVPKEIIQYLTVDTVDLIRVILIAKK